MPKVTSKLQVTVPKALADQYGIRAGDELQWVAAGESIRVMLSGKRRNDRLTLDRTARLDLFDQATRRQTRRQSAARPSQDRSRTGARGWKREDLYRRGISD